MTAKPPPVTVDPKAAKAARERLLKEGTPEDDKSAETSHDSLGPGDDRRERAKENIDIGIVRRTD